MKTQLLARWNAFSAREKSILSGLACVLACLLFYAYIWLPVQQGRERLARLIPEKQAKLLLMQSQAGDVERLRGQYKVLRSAANGLKAAVAVSARFHGLAPVYPATTKNSDPNRLELSLSRISFDSWIRWVESMQSQNHIRVLSAHITPEGGSGQVRVEAILTVAE